MYQTNVDFAAPAIKIEAARVVLDGYLNIPHNSKGIVIFSRCGEGVRQSPGNQFTARELNNAGIATLLFDLLTPKEALTNIITGAFMFNVSLLARRLVAATEWVKRLPNTRKLNVGYLGISTGSAMALIAASLIPGSVKAVVSRGGRTDFALNALPAIQAPTLLIAGGNDPTVLEINKRAYKELKTVKDIIVISGASHLFEEPNALRKVAGLAAGWFEKYLA
jgi:putative phosphoribosyl transferase